MNIWAFVPAGGVGSRMGGGTPKQYLPIGHKEMILHSLERLAANKHIAGVVVGIAETDEHFKAIRPSGVFATTSAGKERADTVLNGLRRLSEFADVDDWVMVHDAARPLIRDADLNRLIQEALRREDGALLALRMTDTVKYANKDQHAQETVDRSQLWRAATPQMFPIQLLLTCLQHALERGDPVTDESSAMELAGYRPALVECAGDNIKITTPTDLSFAQWLMRQQEQES